MDVRLKLLYIIQQVLLQRQSPIHEFTLIVPADYHFFELDQILQHLARNHTVRKLDLLLHEVDWYKIPLCVFSMHHLTDLYLHHFDLDHKPTFSGFGNLKSLSLKYGKIPTKAILHLLSNCPSLKSFTLWFVPDSIPKELPIPTLIHLKYFCFKEMAFCCSQGLTFIAILLKCSPNLEKIKIKTERYFHTHCYKDEVIPDALKEYSDVWLEHLNALEIKLTLIHMTPMLEFVKFILVRSPKLKNVNIKSDLEKDDEFEVLKALLRAPRISPVEIFVQSLEERDEYID